MNGEQITVVEKDQSQLEVETEDKLDANGKITARKTTIKYTIEEQVTDADVKLAEITGGEKK